MLSVRSVLYRVSRYCLVSTMHLSGSILVYKESMSAVTKIVPVGTVWKATLSLKQVEFLTKEGKVGGYGAIRAVMSLPMLYDSLLT